MKIVIRALISLIVLASAGCFDSNTESENKRQAQKEADKKALEGQAKESPPINPLDYVAKDQADKPQKAQQAPKGTVGKSPPINYLDYVNKKPPEQR